jgi:hypothetical protein
MELIRYTRLSIRMIVWGIGRVMMWVVMVVRIISRIVAIAPVIRVVVHIPIPIIPRIVRITPHCVVTWGIVTTPTINPR